MYQEFLDGAVRLVNRLIGERAGAGVGVRDRDAAEALAADDVGPLLGRAFRIAQRVVGVRVAVRPPVHRETDDVGGRVEAAAAEHAAELTPNLQLALQMGTFPRKPLYR